MAAKAAFDAELARGLIDRRRSTPGAALPILHDLQHQFGYIDDTAVALMADALNISKAEALGIVSFYHDFRRSPVEATCAEALQGGIVPGDGMRRAGHAS